jgi:predicted aldo/keto reductase-like oxidoreductase
MEYVRLGRTGVTVSRLGFGGAPAGLTDYLGKYSPADAGQRRQVIAAIHRALELGITYFDTAPGYGRGAGESIFGQALAGSGPSVFLATKVGASETDVRASVEGSLQRLRRGHIDLLQIHGSSYTQEMADSILAAGGMLDQMIQLKEEGLVCFVGFTSEDNNPAVYRFIASERFDVMQIAYNFLFQHPAEQSRPFGSLFEAQKVDMGICTMRTATSGILQKWVQWVNPANSFDYTPALIQFVLSNPLVHVALVGMRTPEEVEENIRICEDLSGRIDLVQLHGKYV